MFVQKRRRFTLFYVLLSENQLFLMPVYYSKTVLHKLDNQNIYSIRYFETDSYIKTYKVNYLVCFYTKSSSNCNIFWQIYLIVIIIYLELFKYIL